MGFARGLPTKIDISSPEMRL